MITMIADAASFTLTRRSLPDQLRYLAAKLTEGTDPGSVALSLEVIATQQHEEGNLRERLEHASALLEGRSGSLGAWMRACAEVASANRQRADRAEAEVARLQRELDAMREDRDFMQRELWKEA